VNVRDEVARMSYRRPVAWSGLFEPAAAATGTTLPAPTVRSCWMNGIGVESVPDADVIPAPTRAVRVLSVRTANGLCQSGKPVVAVGPTRKNRIGSAAQPG